MASSDYRVKLSDTIGGKKNSNNRHSGVRCRALAIIWTLAATGMPIMPAGAQEVLGADQLNAIADTIRNYKSEDQFDQPPAPPALNGKRFTYELKPVEGESNTPRCQGSPTWDYDNQKSQFDAMSRTGNVDPAKLKSINGSAIQLLPMKKWDRPIILYLTFACEKESLPSYTASNAFGATIQIQRGIERVTAVGFPGLWEWDGIDIWDSSDFWLKTAAGDEARHLAANVRLRVSGTLTTWSDGRTLVCGNEEQPPPSFKFPYDIQQNICVFAAIHERLEFVDASNGEILHVANIKASAK